MKKARLGDIVEIDWVDSESVVLGWAATSDYIISANRPQSYRSAGYLIHSKQRVLLALSVDPSNRRMTNAMSIPASTVISMTVLGRAHKSVRRALKQ